MRSGEMMDQAASNCGLFFSSFPWAASQADMSIWRLPRESNTPPRAVVREFMKHFNSIKKNRDFQEVYQTGKSYANKLLVMYVKKTDRPETRIGISVSKKVGNSVVRHHITRLLRESFRLHEDMTETGLDIVVVARAAAKEESYKTICTCADCITF